MLLRATLGYVPWTLVCSLCVNISITSVRKCELKSFAWQHAIVKLRTEAYHFELLRPNMHVPAWISTSKVQRPA